MVKHNRENLKIEDFLVLEENRNYSEYSHALLDFIDKYEAFFAKPKSEEEEEQAAEINPIGYVPDLLADA